jgi:NADH-quinone oxidoreductase subunit E
MLREKYASHIEKIVSSYDDRRSAVIPMLHLAQDEYKYLPDEAIREVADILDLPATDIFEVAGFYTLFHTRPVGTWVLQVCDDAPCCFCGAEELIATLKQKLGIQEEQTTPDGMFTLQRVKCLAACHRPTVIQVNMAYVYDVTPDKVDGLLNDLRARAERGAVWKLSGSDAEDYELNPDGSLREIKRHIGEIPQPGEQVESPQAAST